MKNNVRTAKTADFDFVKGCWAECFDDDERYVDWNFSENYSASNTLIAEYDGVPAAAMQCIPYTLSCGKSDISARYISGVSTMPNYRRRGLSRRLFEYGLPLMRRQGAAMAFLISAVDGIYEKFGFAKLCERTIYETPTLGDNRTQNKADIDIAALGRIYERQCRDTLHIKRTPSDWQRLINELTTGIGGCAAVSDDSYCFAYSRKGGFEVYEKCGGFDFKPVRNEPFMARITDVEMFLKIFSADFCDNTVIAVSDDFIPQNNGSFIISGGDAVRCDDTRSPQPSISFTISELCRCVLKDTPMFIGNII